MVTSWWSNGSSPVQHKVAHCSEQHGDEMIVVQTACCACSSSAYFTHSSVWNTTTCIQLHLTSVLIWIWPRPAWTWQGCVAYFNTDLSPGQILYEGELLHKFTTYIHIHSLINVYAKIKPNSFEAVGRMYTVDFYCYRWYYSCSNWCMEIKPLKDVCYVLSVSSGSLTSLMSMTETVGWDCLTGWAGGLVDSSALWAIWHCRFFCSRLIILVNTFVCWLKCHVMIRQNTTQALPTITHARDSLLPWELFRNRTAVVNIARFPL